MARTERSAGFVVFRELAGVREYLLLDYGRHWDFPKGHLEGKEDERTAALRELTEETGITRPRIIPGFQREITYFFRDRKKGLIRKTVIFFLCQVDANTEIALSEEHSDFAFLPFPAALDRTTYPTAREVLRQAEQTLETRTSDSDDDTLSAGRASG